MLAEHRADARDDPGHQHQRDDADHGPLDQRVDHGLEARLQRCHRQQRQDAALNQQRRQEPEMGQPVIATAGDQYHAVVLGPERQRIEQEGRRQQRHAQLDRAAAEPGARALAIEHHEGEIAGHHEEQRHAEDMDRFGEVFQEAAGVLRFGEDPVIALRVDQGDMIRNAQEHQDGTRGVEKIDSSVELHSNYSFTWKLQMNSRRNGKSIPLEELVGSILTSNSISPSMSRNRLKRPIDYR